MPGTVALFASLRVTPTLPTVTGLLNVALTVVLSPLTGRAKIEKGQVDFPEPRGFDEEFSEREE